MRPEWSDWARRELTRLGTTEEAYIPCTRRRVYDALAVTYWGTLVEFARGRRRTEEDLAASLSVNPSTLNHWLAGRKTPLLQQLFLTLIVDLRHEVSAFPFPTNRRAVWATVARVLSAVRRDDLATGDGTITPEQWRCVRTFTNAPGSYETLTRTTAPTQEDVNLLGRLLAAGRSATDARITTPEALLDTLRQWVRPFALFRTGLPALWRPFDDDALGPD